MYFEEEVEEEEELERSTENESLEPRDSRRSASHAVRQSSEIDDSLLHPRIAIHQTTIGTREEEEARQGLSAPLGERARNEGYTDS